MIEFFSFSELESKGQTVVEFRNISCYRCVSSSLAGIYLSHAVEEVVGVKGDGSYVSDFFGYAEVAAEIRTDIVRLEDITVR